MSSPQPQPVATGTSGTPAPQMSGTPMQAQGGSSPTIGSSASAKPFIPAKFDLPMLDDDSKNYDHWSTALTLAFTNHSIWPIVDRTKACLDPMTDPAAHDEWCLKDCKGQLMILLTLKKVGQKCIFCTKSSKEY